MLSALGQVQQSVTTDTNEDFRCKKIEDYLSINGQKERFKARQLENYRKYYELWSRLPPEAHQIMSTKRLRTVSSSPSLPRELRGPVSTLQVKVDHVLDGYRRHLGEDTATIVEEAYRLREERAEIDEILYLLETEVPETALKEIARIEAQLANSGVTFAAFDLHNPTPCPAVP